MLISNLLMPALKMLLKNYSKFSWFFPIILLGAFYKGGINEFVIGISDTDTHKLTGLSDSKTYVFLRDVHTIL